MRIPRVATLRWVVALWLLLLVVSLSIWAIRPGASRVWLGLDGLDGDTPVGIARLWAQGQFAPLTPIGFVSLFPVYDVLLVGSLLTAMMVLSIMLLAPSSSDRAGSWFTQPIGELAFPRIRLRVRTLLAVIAIVGLELGWEIVAWRNWRQTIHYAEQLHRYSRSEEWVRQEIESSQYQLATLEAGTVAVGGDDRTPGARTAERAYRRDAIRRQLTYDHEMLVALEQLKRKYQDARRQPGRVVGPDPPLPEPHGPGTRSHLEGIRAGP